VPGRLNLRRKLGFTAETRIFLSSGGFWPHKRFCELASIFEELSLPDTALVLTGYADFPEGRPADSAWVRTLLLEEKQDVADAMVEADLFILHSTKEGFGLVLIEAMLNRTPWVARHFAGAAAMDAYGWTYNTDDELATLLGSFPFDALDKRVEDSFQYALLERTIGRTVDDIEAVVRETRAIEFANHSNAVVPG
jgi:glycosyltransferase involved in cell wall biosynthesis